MDGAKADVWSLAVLLFVMLWGRPPFSEASLDDEEYCRLVSGSFEFPCDVPSGAAAVMRLMLVPDPTIRASLAAVRAHPWVSEWVDVGRSGEGYTQLSLYKNNNSGKPCDPNTVAQVGTAAQATTVLLDDSPAAPRPLSSAPRLMITAADADAAGDGAAARARDADRDTCSTDTTVACSSSVGSHGGVSPHSNGAVLVSLPTSSSPSTSPPTLPLRCGEANSPTPSGTLLHWQPSESWAASTVTADHRRRAASRRGVPLRVLPPSPSSQSSAAGGRPNLRVIVPASPAHSDDDEHDGLVGAVSTLALAAPTPTTTTSGRPVSECNGGPAATGAAHESVVAGPLARTRTATPLRGGTRQSRASRATSTDHAGDDEDLTSHGSDCDGGAGHDSDVSSASNTSASSRRSRKRASPSVDGGGSGDGSGGSKRERVTPRCSGDVVVDSKEPFVVTRRARGAAVAGAACSPLGLSQPMARLQLDGRGHRGNQTPSCNDAITAGAWHKLNSAGGGAVGPIPPIAGLRTTVEAFSSAVAVAGCASDGAAVHDASSPSSCPALLRLGTHDADLLERGSYSTSVASSVRSHRHKRHASFGGAGLSSASSSRCPGPAVATTPRPTGTSGMVPSSSASALLGRRVLVSPVASSPATAQQAYEAGGASYRAKGRWPGTDSPRPDATAACVQRLLDGFSTVLPVPAAASPGGARSLSWRECVTPTPSAAECWERCVDATGRVRVPSPGCDNSGMSARAVEAAQALFQRSVFAPSSPSLPTSSRPRGGV